MKDKIHNYFQIPMAIESGNNFVNRPTWAYKNYRDRWSKILRLKMGQADQVAIKKMSVRIVRYCSRSLDQDNFIMGSKPILDYLTEGGWIMDDAPDYVLVNYSQLPNKKAVWADHGITLPMSTIEIWEEPGGKILKPVKRQLHKRGSLPKKRGRNQHFMNEILKNEKHNIRS